MLGLTGGRWWARAGTTVASAVTHVWTASSLRDSHPRTSDVLIGLLVAIVIGAVLIAFSTKVQRTAVFLNHAKYPFRNYDDPSFVGPGVKIEHFAVDTADDAQVHGWYVTSEDDTDGDTPIRVTRSRVSRKQSKPTILYCHGNTSDRGAGHRIELYRRLVVELGYRVVAIDYRGFAHAPGTPTEEGVLADARAAFEWCAARHGASNIYLWGHSLGGGVATGTAMRLQEDGVPIGGLILEGTFTSLAAAMRAYPLAWPVYPFPLLLDMVEHKMLDRFENARKIGRLQVPTLIFHGTRDAIVPFSHGAELSRVAEAERSLGGSVTFQPVEGAGHCDIWQSPLLVSALTEFMGSAH
eukprot:m.32936 g.32936  ORF g.32936 m.32936 type:complete len:353 (-) comp7124_c0_seq1:211-1269(-)